MEIDESRFKKEKERAKNFYESLIKIYCPYLKTEIHFNSEGFEHLLTKAWNKGRARSEQYTRLRLLPKVVDILKLCHTLQEYEERLMFVRQKINSRWERRAKRVFYYVFVTMLIRHGIRFKIVVKQIEGGQPFFWSVYPSWKVFKDENGFRVKCFYTGNLEEI